MKSASNSIRVIVIYRPPPSKNNTLSESTFFSEFSTLLEDLVSDSGNVLANDFNFHVNDSSNASAKKFLSLITSFDYKNYVHDATLKKGHTLDLLLTRCDDKFVSNIDVIDPSISNHSAVNCKLLLAKPPPIRKHVSFRDMKKINFNLFRTDLKKSGLFEITNTSTLAESYENVLSTLLDTYAPVKTKTVTIRHDTSCYTPEIQEQKIIKRRLERRWRTTKLMVDREVYTQQYIVVNRLISAAKTNYYKDMINSGGSDQRELFNEFDRIFKSSVEGEYPSCASTDQLANNFADFFDKKIDSIRKELSTKPANTAYSDNTESILLNEIKLESFAPITVGDMLVLTRNLIKKSCVLDPIPVKVLTECYTDLLPVITNITNTSLGTATVPDNLKSAALDPRLKKDNLSTDEYSSFRPISSLKFISKCIEKVVAEQLDHHITSNVLDEAMQSAFKKHHSTETALIKVQNDILQAIDNQNSVILLLLDLSAAFDTIDHETLLSRLSSRHGIIGEAHKWFEHISKKEHIGCMFQMINPLYAL